MALHHDDVTAAFKQRRTNPEEYDQYVTPETYDELIEILSSAEVQVQHQLGLYEAGLGNREDRDEDWYVRAKTVARLYKQEVARLNRLVTRENVNRQTRFAEMKRRYQYVVKNKEEDLAEWKKLVLDLADFIDELNGDLADFQLPSRDGHDPMTLQEYYHNYTHLTLKGHTP